MRPVSNFLIMQLSNSREDALCKEKEDIPNLLFILILFAFNYNSNVKNRK